MQFQRFILLSLAAQVYATAMAPTVQDHAANLALQNLCDYASDACKMMF